jgi:hypothetical protein
LSLGLTTGTHIIDGCEINCANHAGFWIQSKCADIRLEGGGAYGTFRYNVPDPDSYTCDLRQTYASINDTNCDSGIIFTGSEDYDFCTDDSDNICQERASVEGWVVGDESSTDYFSGRTVGGQLKTSYNYIKSRITEAGLEDGSNYFYNIDFNDNDLPNGIYDLTGDLDVPSGGYTFPEDRNYVILIDGNLNINGEIKVPVGSTATFVASGDIFIDELVGEDVDPEYSVCSLTDPDYYHIEGMYSADGDLILDGNRDCEGAGADKRLNVAGSFVVNAALSGGIFDNQRSLCSCNELCPVFHFSVRPDFVLNAPELIKSTNYIWKEVAP